jgi:uncharacterized protein YjiS (DUF1127 family)
MSALDHCTDQMSAASRPAFTARAIQAVTKTYRAWKNRREFYRLGEMSEFELADIGLRRTDLQVAMRGPFGEDPTARLGVIAEARAIEREDAARQVC